MATPEAHFEDHHHDSIVHSHEHWHVTHNFRRITGGFERLSWKHEHDHDHTEVSHSHYPHEDFESEHRDEAHDHDHGEPVKERAPSKATATKSAAKGTAAKATTRPLVLHDGVCADAFVGVDCRQRVPKPHGRAFVCPHCGYRGHRTSAG